MSSGVQVFALILLFALLVHALDALKEIKVAKHTGRTRPPNKPPDGP